MKQASHCISVASLLRLWPLCFPCACSFQSLSFQNLYVMNMAKQQQRASSIPQPGVRTRHRRRFLQFPRGQRSGRTGSPVGPRAKTHFGESVMDLRVQLKVCEGCGCLWYRSQFEAGVYCAPCDRRFQEFPAPLSRKRRGRPRKAILPTVHAVGEMAHAVEDTGHRGTTRISPPCKPVAGIRSLSSHHTTARRQESAATLAKGGAQ